MGGYRIIILVLLAWSLLTGAVQLAMAQTLPDRPLIVGTKQAPPFAMKNSDGTWSGISIDLWRAMANDLKLTYELREFDLQGLLDAVTQGDIDLAVAAVTITAAREEVMDFSHPFHITGFGIALPRGAKRPWFGVLRSFFSWQFLYLISGLALLLLIVGALIWLSERKRNPQQFGDGVVKGIWSGFWWAAVTMTTVGYGDKAPATVRGRVLALIWMFAGLIIISSFIAAITSALTVTHLESAVNGPQDLARLWVATVPGSTSETYLRQRRIATKRYASPLEGLQAVARGEADAIVYDAPLLRYLATTELQGQMEVLPAVFERQHYGIAMPSGSPLREPINRLLLDKIHKPAWQDVLSHYLGK